MKNTIQLDFLLKGRKRISNDDEDEDEAAEKLRVTV